MGRQLPDLDVSAVSSDDEEASIRIIRHLIDLGHRRIAHIEGGDKAGARERKFRISAHHAANGAADDRNPRNTHDIDSGRLGVERLLQEENRPTAIFADNDLTAIGVINELNRRGYAFPGYFRCRL